MPNILNTSLNNLKSGLAFHRIYRAITAHNDIICLRHKDPDPDAIGSQHGLATIIKNTFPDKHVYCLGESNADLNWMYPMTAAGYFDITPDPDNLPNALVIVTDCPDDDRVSGLNWLKSNDYIVIDHHPAEDVAKNANYAWINPEKSSASEMVCDLAFHTRLKMNYRAASLLYAGIIGDTGRFMFPGSTFVTFTDVAKLAAYGIDMNSINRKETETTIQATHLYGYLDQHLHMLPGGVVYYVVTKKLMKKFNISPDTFISKNVPGNIKGVIAWAMFTEADDNVLKISLRSHGPAINKLAAKYNGGGHALASGARIPNNTNTKANVKKVVRDLEDVVDHYEDAKTFKKLDK